MIVISDKGCNCNIFSMHFTSSKIHIICVQKSCEDYIRRLWKDYETKAPFQSLTNKTTLTQHLSCFFCFFVLFFLKWHFQLFKCQTCPFLDASAPPYPLMVGKDSISFSAQGMCLHGILCMTWRAAVEILHLGSPDRSSECVIILIFCCWDALAAWWPILSM